MALGGRHLVNETDPAKKQVPNGIDGDDGDDGDDDDVDDDRAGGAGDDADDDELRNLVPESSLVKMRIMIDINWNMKMKKKTMMMK